MSFCLRQIEHERAAEDQDLDVANDRRNTTATIGRKVTLVNIVFIKIYLRELFSECNSCFLTFYLIYFFN